MVGLFVYERYHKSHWSEVRDVYHRAKNLRKPSFLNWVYSEPCIILPLFRLLPLHLLLYIYSSLPMVSDAVVPYVTRVAGLRLECVAHGRLGGCRRSRGCRGP